MNKHNKYARVLATVENLMLQEPFNNGDWNYSVRADTCSAQIWQKNRELLISLHNFVNIDTLYPERLTDLASNGLAAPAAAQREIQAILGYHP